MVKTYIKYGLMAMGLVLAFLVFFEARSCKNEKTESGLRDDITYLEGQLQEHEIQAAKKKKEMEKRIEERERQIEEYQQEIVVLQHESYETEKEMEAESQELQALKEKFNLLEDKDARIANLKLQVGSLERSFSLAQHDIALLKQERDKWKASYYTEKETSADLRKQLTLQEQAFYVAENLINKKDQQIKKLKKQKWLYQIIGAGIGYGVGRIMGGD